MKNLFYSLCLLIGFSSQASSLDFDIHSLNINDIEKNITKAPDCELDAIFIVSQEDLTDDSFEFDTKKYLPENFNAFTGLFDAYELVQEVADESFDFDTKAYLPVGFNANATYLSNITEIATVEADEAFDFNTADYLPVGFNVYPILEEVVEIDIIEEDEPFDFNTNDYLPSTFDAYVNIEQSETANFLDCIAFPSI